MTTLATSPVAEPDLLALVADGWTPLGRTAADRFREACLDEALAHDGRVDPNSVRARLLVDGALDIDPRTYSALWSTACAAGGYLAKTDELVPITGEGSRHNGGKSIRVRRWIADMTPAPAEDLGKTESGAGQTPEGEVAPASGHVVGRIAVRATPPRPPVNSSPGGRDRSIRSHVPAPVAPSPVTGTERFPAGRQGPHDYGPHTPETAPTKGTVRCGGDSVWCAQPGCRSDHEIDLPVALVKQRRRINELAAAR